MLSSLGFFISSLWKIFMSGVFSAATTQRWPFRHRDLHGQNGKKNNTTTKGLLLFIERSHCFENYAQRFDGRF